MRKGLKGENEFKVSVIIPVYNAERYVKKAVESALQQSEVTEVIIVEDGSTDHSPKIIEELKDKHLGVFVFQHRDGQNMGRAASRNLGIRNASNEFIAFLDADDFYLNNRFKNDKILLEANPEIDGVYNAIGAHFYRDSTKEERKELKLTTLKYPVAPHLLFHHMAPKGKAGWFSGNGLIVKRKVFENVGFFNEELEVAEDTHMWIRMSLKANLIPGLLNEPVSMRGIHHDNVFNQYGEIIYRRNYAKLYISLLKWTYDNRLNPDVLGFFWEKSYSFFTMENKKKRKLGAFMGNSFYWIQTALRYPRLLKNPSFLVISPLHRIYNSLTKK